LDKNQLIAKDLALLFALIGCICWNGIFWPEIFLATVVKGFFYDLLFFNKSYKVLRRVRSLLISPSLLSSAVNSVDYFIILLLR